MQTVYVDSIVQEALQMLKNGNPGKSILAHLATASERIAGGNSVSSILALDKEGLLRNAASPHLPNDYIAAIDGIRPDPKVGTCAAAAATGKIVVTTDFHEDAKWSELRHLPLSLGFVGAWSMPIKAKDGTVLGTFGTYFREKRRPDATEIDAVQLFSNVAARVLEASA